MKARIDFSSRLAGAPGLEFSDPERVVAAREPGEVPTLLAEIQDHCQRGGWAVGFVAFEAASAFDPALETHDPADGVPVALFGLYAAPSATPESHSPACADFILGPWRPEWSRDRHAAAFQAVSSHIRQGDTYQTNLTFAGRAAFLGSARGCYERLRDVSRAGYCGFLEHGDLAVASVSPELFFERSGDVVLSRPMKGTRPRMAEENADLAMRRDLESCPKDRAENVMIVDMLRNDLGRVAVPGTVRVPRLFTVEAYPTVWQMTSEVTARVERGTPLAGVFRALFPCASVTGAPKVATMRLIRDIEDGPRGVYCGAFGVVSPGGDCVFNVAIRTLVLRSGTGFYHVGSGVVADSRAGDEYLECLAKARVLEGGGSFRLLETTVWSPRGGFGLLAEHLDRLRSSAATLGFVCDPETVRRELEAAAAGWDEDMRVRVLLSPGGGVEVEARPVDAPRDRPWRLALASMPVEAANPWLRHKTTRRDVFEAARADMPRKADDVILYNAQGFVTETTVANLAVYLGGEWLTPPESCGLLAGTMRRRLLETGEIREGLVRVRDLESAPRLRIMNSVRGLAEAVVVSGMP